MPRLRSRKGDPSLVESPNDKKKNTGDSNASQGDDFYPNYTTPQKRPIKKYKSPQSSQSSSQSSQSQDIESPPFMSEDSPVSRRKTKATSTPPPSNKNTVSTPPPANPPSTPPRTASPLKEPKRVGRRKSLELKRAAEKEDDEEEKGEGEVKEGEKKEEEKGQEEVKEGDEETKKQVESQKEYFSNVDKFNLEEGPNKRPIPSNTQTAAQKKDVALFMEDLMGTPARTPSTPNKFVTRDGPSSPYQPPQQTPTKTPASILRPQGTPSSSTPQKVQISPSPSIRIITPSPPSKPTPSTAKPTPNKETKQAKGSKKKKDVEEAKETIAAAKIPTKRKRDTEEATTEEGAGSQRRSSRLKDKS